MTRRASPGGPQRGQRGRDHHGNGSARRRAAARRGKERECGATIEWIIARGSDSPDSRYALAHKSLRRVRRGQSLPAFVSVCRSSPARCFPCLTPCSRRSAASPPPNHPKCARSHPAIPRHWTGIARHLSAHFTGILTMGVIGMSVIVGGIPTREELSVRCSSLAVLGRGERRSSWSPRVRGF